MNEIKTELIKVMDNRDGAIYDAFPQFVDLGHNGKYELRLNIGINGYHEFTNVCCVYDNREFNERYTVVKYSYAKKEYIPETEYKFWIDGENAKQGV